LGLRRWLILLIATFGFAPPAIAQAVPDIIGVYQGASTITIWGCANPSDNKTTVAIGSIDISEQNGNAFSGEAVFSALIEGTSVTETLSLSGTVTTGGSLSGSATSQASVESAPAGSAQAAFTGTSASNGIQLKFPAGAVGVDGCNHSGATLAGTRCGNGSVEGSEECDDGNAATEDGCTPQCIIEFCGDGILQTGLGEFCDDGDLDPNDTCDNACMIPEPNTTLFRVAGCFVLALMQRRRCATGRISQAG